jgi:DNA-binding IclR family transcriptional regulator
MGQKAKNPVKAAETTFEIIQALKELDGAGVTELATHLDLPKSTVHNYLSTLHQEEYIVKSGSEYEVGIKFLELGNYARDRMRIYEIAKPEIDSLADQTGELVNLLVEEHGKGVYIYQAAGQQSVRVDSSVGSRVYLHATAFGKAMLANYSPERVDRIIESHGLPQFTDRTSATRAELESDFETIRDQGYAIDDEERLSGLRCIGTEIKANDGRVLGGVSISGPVNRLNGSYLREELPDILLETANVIELNITYS